MGKLRELCNGDYHPWDVSIEEATNLADVEMSPSNPFCDNCPSFHACGDRVEAQITSMYEGGDVTLLLVNEQNEEIQLKSDGKEVPIKFDS